MECVRLCKKESERECDMKIEKERMKKKNADAHKEKMDIAI